MGSTAESATGEKRGITGSTLKMIAIIAMFIDHVGAIIVERMMLQTINGADGAALLDRRGLVLLDMVLRLIGRIGFPIFCFLLIEGFIHTRNVKKYALRLLLFALISEVPFNLGFCGDLFNGIYQNVFFTLFIGLLVMMVLRIVEQRQDWRKGIRIIAEIGVAAVGMVVAELLRTDYGAIGVLTITAMYLYRQNRVLQALFGCMVLTVMNMMEISSFAMLIPIRLYNGKRGWNMKWFFYAFYPIHILILYLVACALGLGNVAMR